MPSSRNYHGLRSEGSTMTMHDASMGSHSPDPSAQTYASSERQLDERLATSVVSQDGQAGIGRAIDELHALADANQSATAFAQQQANTLQADVLTRSGPNIRGHYY